jgi:hypothetical protein
MRRCLALAIVILGGCPAATAPACITVDTTCAPGYVPNFDNVYRNTLASSCGATRTACHSAAGHQGNMSFEDEATAYAQLMLAAHADPSRLRVKPGDPACSLMIVRTDSPGADYQMPPGDPLPAAERCALIQWVQCGAPGPGSSCP